MLEEKLRDKEQKKKEKQEIKEKLQQVVFSLSLHFSLCRVLLLFLLQKKVILE